MPNMPLAYAIDFGTTNSLVAPASAERALDPLPVDPTASDPTLLRSVLFFAEDGAPVTVGADALRACTDSGMRGRLIRSIKRFLPVTSFTETRIFGRRFSLEELVAIVLRTLRQRANALVGGDVRTAVIGRPARFSDDPAADRLAVERLQMAARLAGFEHVVLCEEPVAAAQDRAGQGSRTELVAVADLGGGTSDFTIAWLGDGAFEVLAVNGIAVAGDALDGALMRDHVSPFFGSRVAYRMPFGHNVLTFPKPLLEKLCSPAELSLLDRRDVIEFLSTIRSFALRDEDRERMDRLLCLVQDRLGFQIFEAIEQTKRALSLEASAPLLFDYPGIELLLSLGRQDFEISSAPSIARIVARFEETMASAGVDYPDLDRIYFTGGTAQVPAVTAAIALRAGAEKVQQLRTFHAVVEGLAERARLLVREHPCPTQGTKARHSNCVGE
jgi:hypothetical chaperone protein